jgi:hypothetical protein
MASPININDEYLRYWKNLDEDSTGNPNTGIYQRIYTYKDNREFYIDDTKGYPTYIKNINLDNLPDLSNISNANKFIYSFLEEMFNNISIKKYLKSPTDKKQNIFRANHGGLNHFRSFLFSAYVINIFITTKLELFKKYITKNKIELIFLLLSSYFQSFLRVNESANPVNFFNTTNINFENIFIEISKNNDIKTYFTNNTMKIHMTTLASSFLFMSICKYLKSINETIRNNLTDEFIEKIGLGLCMVENDNNTLNTSNDNLKSIFLFYGIISFGHYSDHCRLYSFSNILEQIHIKFLLENIGIVINGNKNYINILKYIILLLSLTEWKNDDTTNFIDLKKKDDNYWVNLINTNNSQSICKKFGKSRYDNPNFQTYSANFKLMYDGIKLELDDFINFENNINNNIKFINDDDEEAKKKASSKKKICSMKSLLNLSGGYYKINRGNKNTKKNILKIKKINKINKKTKTQKYKK